MRGRPRDPRSIGNRGHCGPRTCRPPPAPRSKAAATGRIAAAWARSDRAAICRTMRSFSSDLRGHAAQVLLHLCGIQRHHHQFLRDRKAAFVAVKGQVRRAFGPARSSGICSAAPETWRSAPSDSVPRMRASVRVRRPSASTSPATRSEMPGDAFELGKIAPRRQGVVQLLMVAGQLRL